MLPVKVIRLNLFIKWFFFLGIFITKLQLPAAIPFFKSQQSLFPSGASNLETLQRLEVNVPAANQANAYRSNGQIFQRNEIRPIWPVHLSEFVLDQGTKQRWRVLKADNEVFTLQNTQTSNVLTFNLAEIISDPSDLGLAQTIKDVYLRSGPEEHSKILTTIPQGLRLKPNHYTNDFLKVSYKNYVGYIRLSEVITKFDLCHLVFAKQRWHFVKNRKFDQIITNEGLSISLNSVTHLITSDQKGLIASESQKIPIWSRVELILGSNSNQTSTSNVWKQSQLPGHGVVWWQQSTNTETQTLFTTDQLLQKKISSVSFHPKNPLKGILSASGIYVTEDGQNWRKLPQFENYNGPVHYFNDLLIFVGSYRSVDGGRSFENYIQVDKLALAIDEQLGITPQAIQLRKISTRPPFQLELEVASGRKVIHLESPLFSQQWRIAKAVKTK